MATVAELEARLEALKAQRGRAVARVSYDGRSVECRDTAEIARAISDEERELQALQGTSPVCQILPIPHAARLLLSDGRT
jgi:hypothetical protein